MTLLVPKLGRDIIGQIGVFKMVAGAAQDKLHRSRLTREDAVPEIRCDACKGHGSPAVRASANRRIYLATCKKCGGKGRIRKPD